MADLRQSIKSADGFHYDAIGIAALEELRESLNSTALTIRSLSSNHHFDIPQSVSSIFTGRETLLQELRETLVLQQGQIQDQFQRRFIIQGLGGSGKTQFCCKFAQDNRDRWVYTTSQLVRQCLKFKLVSGVFSGLTPACLNASSRL